jgi:hypothetical protein
MATLWSDVYEISELRSARVAQHFNSINRYWLVHGAATSLLCAFTFFVSTFLKRKALFRAGFVVTVLLLVATGVYSNLWSEGFTDCWPQSWSYLRFLFLLLVPLMTFAVIDSLRSPRFDVYRGTLSVLCALFFAGNACFQGYIQYRNTERLKQIFAASETTVIDMSEHRWTNNTPFGHWSMPSYAIIMQGRNPTKVVLAHKNVADARERGLVRLTPWAAPFENKWFHLPDTREANQP